MRFNISSASGSMKQYEEQLKQFNYKDETVEIESLEDLNKISQIINLVIRYNGSGLPFDIVIYDDYME